MKMRSQTGISTRQIDEYIQRIFEGLECTITDHYGTREASQKLFRRLMERLKLEHSFGKPLHTLFNIDLQRLTISLKD